MIEEVVSIGGCEFRFGPRIFSMLSKGIPKLLWIR